MYKMFLQIYNLNNSTNENPICILKQGEHVIGRGDLLECQDKRISRRHALIKIEDKNATITSTHKNPCFFQSGSSTTIIILSKDVPTELNDGDKFGMFPDQFWFRTKFRNEDISANNTLKSDEILTVDDEHVVVHKRSLEEATDNTQHKIPKIENGEMPSTHKIEAVCDNIRNDSSDTVANEKLVSETVSTVTEESPDSNIQITTAVDFHQHHSQNNEITNNVQASSLDKANISDNSEVITENADQAIPSSSGTGTSTQTGNTIDKPTRDKCWYGKDCFRKSTHHKKEFSHPGDSDYESDPKDARPVCRYGLQCYRKNKEHLEEYRHTRVNKKPGTKRREKKTRNPKQPKAAANESSDDDYDYDDPFFNDDSEDAYEEESWSDDDSDDDWTESNDDKQDDEDTRTLMKEAKRFTRQKK